jgi:hypothetical protein
VRALFAEIWDSHVEVSIISGTKVLKLVVLKYLFLRVTRGLLLLRTKADRSSEAHVARAPL